MIKNKLKGTIYMKIASEFVIILSHFEDDAYVHIYN